jgi:predicted MPP superfamily phosphohydrolase
MMLTRRGFLKFVWRMMLAGAAVTTYATGVEAMGTPDVTTFRLTPKGWTPGLKLRIVALADFHACEPWMDAKRISKICAQANALGGDVILLLGDYIVGPNIVLGRIAPEAWAGSLAQLSAPLGVHAILGNHDYHDDADYRRDFIVPTAAERALDAVNIPVLVNRAIRLEKDGHGFWLAGLGDQMATEPVTFRRGIDDLEGLQRQITDSDPAILLAHEPDIFPQAGGRFSLTLSGHTHGGQVNLFGWRPVAASRGSRIYPVGHYHEGGRDLVVSRGLGCTGMPVRIGSWPEILVLELG